MHREYLLHALALAEKRRGFCSPNPSVGAVVVKEGQLIGRGYHLQAGAPHAEVMALLEAGEQAQDATVYVTLEPCCHYGRTPPCTDLLIEKKVREVVYALADPNPTVFGQGEQQLREAGIICTHVPLPEITQFYQSYQFWTQHQRPFMTAKLALSLDGKIADNKGQPLSLTGEKALEFTHVQRKQSDAILTSLKTILHDDPKFNARLAKEVVTKPVCVVDTRLEFPLTAQLNQTAQKIILLHQEQVDPHKLKSYQAKGVDCIAVASYAGQLDLSAVIASLGEQGFHDIWVEAGGALVQSLLSAKLLQRIYFYLAPMLLGKMGYTAFSEPCLLQRDAQHIQWQALGIDGLCQIDFI